MLMRIGKVTDFLEHLWETYIMKRAAAAILVVVYLGVIAIIEINRLFDVTDALTTNHFYAVDIAFTLLLFTEVVSLIFALTRSFSRSVGIQLEILSLILLRDTFKQFKDFGEPIEWEQATEGVVTMISDSIGALVIFVIIGFYYRSQRRLPITTDEREQKEFIAYKKLIALGLVIVFALIGLVDIFRFLAGLETYPFFETFYTVLIFTDILMVLISLQYARNFAVTFRNFGYAVVTVFIRITLIAPAVIAALLGIGTALFALSLTLAYNRSGATIAEEAADEEVSDTAPIMNAEPAPAGD